MLKIISKIISAALVIFGIGLFLYPQITEVYVRYNTTKYMDAFNDKFYDPTDNEKQTDDNTNQDGYEYKNPKTYLPGLYKEIKKYNKQLFDTDQSDFVDAFSYEDVTVDISGLEDGVFGYIEIPKMDLKMPLYLGANYSNMNLGAAVLGNTSIPIGGKNTNSVVAGHRGWARAAYFLYIEDLAIGDHVFITNPWEKLAYKVTDIVIIDPYDTDALKIRPGKDMITLLTCHPYLSHGKYRYLVFCERDPGYTINQEKSELNSENNGRAKSPADVGYITSSDGTVYESSAYIINNENKMRMYAGGIILFMVTITTVINIIINNRKNKHRHSTLKRRVKNG